MASTAKAATKDGGPLSFMTRLSQYVYLYRPSTTTTSPSNLTAASQRPAPKLILLLSWMGARDPHIAKYITPYQALYPSTPILLIKSEMKHIFKPKAAWPDMEVAVPVLREIFGSEMLPPGSSNFGSIQEGSTTALTSSPTNAGSRKDDDEPELLIHLFSNGGSSQLLTLHSFLLSQPSLRLRLPPHLVIFDSAPGQMAYWPSYSALSHVLLPPPSRARFPLWLFSPSTLRRLLVAPLIHLWVSFLWTSNFLSRLPFLKWLESPLAKLARQQNDTCPGKGRAEKERGRMYIYSEEDELVGYKDVERHMEGAKERGLRVRREKVEGTGHVGHARGEENSQRYWSLVGSFWEGDDLR